MTHTPMRIGVCEVGDGSHAATIAFPSTGFQVGAIGASGIGALRRAAAAAERVVGLMEGHEQAARALKTMKIAAWAIEEGRASGAIKTKEQIEAVGAALGAVSSVFDRLFRGRR